MIQEKEKWAFLNDSLFNIPSLNNSLISLSSSQIKSSTENNINLSNSNNLPNFPTLHSDHPFPANLTYEPDPQFFQTQQITITVTYANYSNTPRRSETIKVSMTDCPISLCHGIDSSSCADNGLINNQLPCFTSQSNFKIIFEGRVLSPALSFSFQGVKDGSELFVIHSNQNSSTSNIRRSDKFLTPNQIITKRFLTNGKRENIMNHLHQRFDKQWGNKFHDSDSVFEQIKDSIDPTTAGESARLSDIKRLRAEENNNTYQKVCQRFQKIESSNDYFPNYSIPTIVPGKQSEPSSSPLPGLREAQYQPNNFSIMMINVQSPNLCRSKIFSDELF